MPLIRYPCRILAAGRERIDGFRRSAEKQQPQITDWSAGSRFVERFLAALQIHYRLLPGIRTLSAYILILSLVGFTKS